MVVAGEKEKEVKMVNQAKIDDISSKLYEINACWAGSQRKYIASEDGYDALPTYHIHPDADRLDRVNILKFTNLDDLVSWIGMRKRALKAKTDDEASNIMLDWVLKGNRNERRRSYNRK